MLTAKDALEGLKSVDMGLCESCVMVQCKKILYTDSQSAIQLVKNPVYHSRTKHIRRQYHLTRRLVEEDDMCLEKIEGAKNPTDMLTKCIDVEKLRLCKALIGIM